MATNKTKHAPPRPPGSIERAIDIHLIFALNIANHPLGSMGIKSQLALICILYDITQETVTTMLIERARTLDREGLLLPIYSGEDS